MSRQEGRASVSFPSICLVTILTGWALSANAMNCKLAKTATEKSICANPALKERDDQLNQDYFALQKHFKSTGKDNCHLEDQSIRQKEWLGERDQCGSDDQCLLDAYEKRLGEIHSFARKVCSPHDNSPIFAGRACAKQALVAPTVSTSPDKQEPPVQQCSQADRVNYPFIKKEEGLMLDAYVPGPYTTDENKTHQNLGPRYLKNGQRGNVVGKSGITVGFGVDLGQQTEQGLRRYMQAEERDYGKPTKVNIERILSRLKGLYRHKRGVAVAVLDAYKDKNKHYPKLERDEAVFLSRAVTHGYYQNAIRYYNRRSKMDLRALPAAVQTVVTDAAFNGWGPVKQKVRGMLFNGKWQAAADALLHDDNKNLAYRERNRLRGLQLQEAMASGNLPKSGDPCKNIGGKLDVARIEYRQRYRIMPNGSYLV